MLWQDCIHPSGGTDSFEEAKRRWREQREVYDGHYDQYLRDNVL